jgi:Protein of unknown function (DUF3175)
MPARKQRGRRYRTKDSRRWSAGVTRGSNALDLEPSVFTWSDPRRIASSLKRSSERSRRRKSTPFRSAMSMLTFYINRAGDGLSTRQRRVLEQAKEELRILFKKPTPTPRRRKTT